jgi:hypothetical protein
MISRDWRVFGLEWSECEASTCCSNIGENVASPSVAFSGCAMVEKACCVGISCRSKGLVYVKYEGKQIVEAQF